MQKQILILHSRGQSLEDLFFFKQDASLLAKREQLRKMERNIETLSEISGIQDESLLRKLADLNIQIEVLATLSIIPLIELARADGKIDEKEQQEILEAAERFGICKSPVNRSLFAHWLKNDPPDGLIDSWIFYMQGLSQLLNKKERLAFKTGFLNWAKKVAEAGTGKPKNKAKAGRRKRELLLRMEQAFEPLNYKV